MSQLPRHLLPKNLLLIAEHVSDQAMLSIWDHYAGCVLNVPAPHHLGHDHPLRQILGSEAIPFCQAFARENISIPRAHKALLHIRNYQIRQGRDSGKSYNRLASEYNLTTRQIMTICESVNLDPPPIPDPL